MRKGIQTVIVGGVLALLSACSQPAIPTPTTDSMAQMVQIGPGDTPAAIEQSYGGHVVVWQPEAQTAILEVAAGHTQGLTTAAQHSEVIASEPNTNAILVPEHNHDTPGLSTQGWTAWSGGYTAWSGGYTAWSGGWTAWSGGTAEGSESPNREAWQQIGLYDTDGLAPHYGAGITVAVIDTGIDLRHPMFQGHLAPGHDFVDDDPEPQEVPAPEGQRSGYGHGTAVAGIILQVAPNATILPLRVLRPDGSGDLTAVIAAIDWAMNAGVDVINLSLGAQRHSPSLQFMIDQATQEGIYVISSSGNSGDQRVTYPAARSTRKDTAGHYSLGIGSVETNDVKADYSTYGHKLELLAPGTEITTAAPNNQQAYWTGTSMATAITSGALALGLAEHPDLTSAAVILADTAQPIDQVNAQQLRGKLGHGRIDVSAFLEALNH